MKKSVTVYLSLLLLIAVSASAQITIPTNDYMPAIGSSAETGQADNINATIYDALTSGTGSMFFDFSQLNFPDFALTTVVDPAGAPFLDSFPNTNFVTVNVEGSGGTDSIWSYHNSVPLSFTNLGVVTQISGLPGTVSNYEMNTPDFIFPMDYQDQWTTTRYSATNFFGTSSETYDTIFNSIDAYGTATYNGQSIPCLRVNFVERLTTITTFMGLPPIVSTSTLEGAYFFGEGFDFFASLQKADVSGSVSYFANAAGSFVKIPTDIKENKTDNLPDNFNLSQNYPNPFNPSTEIQFSLPTAAEVKLEVFNVQGRLTNLLVDKRLTAGSYSFVWDGKNNSGRQVASGVYFYRLTTGDFTSSKKMLLLK